MDPLEQVLPEAKEAVIVAVPVPTKLARPLVAEEKLTTEVLLEAQVTLAVTSEPFWVAKNCELVPLVNGPAGVIEMVCPEPPVTLPVTDPLTPDTLAVIVTLLADPTPVTSPALLTVAQEVELLQLAEFVTSLEPLSKAAVAFSCTVEPEATVNEVPPDAVVTETEFG